MSSNFGHLFRISTFGESHGGAVGVVIDGCPPRIPIDAEMIQRQLSRRRPGQSSLTTARQEPDQVEILSGVFEGETLGSPIALVVKNKDARSDDYKDFKDIYRPSHADYTYEAKYGTRNWKGGGRTSARETIGRVAAGALARHFLARQCGAEVVAWVEQIGDIDLAPEHIDILTVNEIEVDATPVRCPHPETAEKMIARIEEIKAAGDSLGGVIRCIARHVPPGLGEPVFDRLEADLAKACMSLPATKGFEIGSGFAGTRLTGSAHNDLFVPAGADEERPEEMARDNRPPLAHTTTNYSGGIQGGISNGEIIDLRVAFKPTATIFKMQQSVNADGEQVDFRPKGRHDPCVLPRAVPMVEAMVGLVLADHYLRHVAQNCLPPVAP